MSHLITPQALGVLLESLGFRVHHWYDVTQEALAWFRQVVEHVKLHGPPPLGPALLLGAEASVTQENQVRNLEEGRIVLLQAVLEKTR
jgi:hypothetical protein